MVQMETLMRYAHIGSDYRNWYVDAAQAIATICARHGWDSREFTEVMAITSPRVQVARNWGLTWVYMKTGKLPDKGVLPTTRLALKHWQETGVIRGKKTGPFAAALQGDNDALVLDVWMAVALGVDPGVVTRTDNAAAAARRVARIASVMGWTVAETQAAIWCGVIIDGGGMPARFETAADGGIKLHSGATKPLFGD